MNPQRNEAAVRCAYLQHSLEAMRREYATQGKALLEYAQKHDALLAEVRELRQRVQAQ